MSSLNKKSYTLSVSKTKVKTKSMSQSNLRSGFCAANEKLLSQRSSQGRSLREKPSKRQFESDSEVESENAVKEMLLKENYEWIFCDDLSVFTLKTTSEAWLNTDYRQKYTLPEDSYIDLMFSDFKFRARLLCKGPQKDLKGVEENYWKLIDTGTDCSALEITVIGSTKPMTIRETEELAGNSDVECADTETVQAQTKTAEPIIELGESRRSADSSIRNTNVSPIHFDEADEKEDQSVSLTQQSCSTSCKNFDEYLAEHEKTVDLMLSAFEKKKQEQLKRNSHLLSSISKEEEMLREKLLISENGGFQSIDDYPELSKEAVSVMHNNFDLMKIYAGKDAGSFGRDLGDKLIEKKFFGTRMLSPRRVSNKLSLRSPLDAETEGKFKRVVKLKYPRTPTFAYETCRRACNQMMRDSRKGSQKVASDNLGSRSLESDNQNSQFETDDDEDQVDVLH